MIVYLIIASLMPIEGKILRVGKQFYANFAIVDSQARVTSNCIRNFTSMYSSKQCAKECVDMEQCKTFNYHVKQNICELLNISKFDVLGILRKVRHWTHYETDEDASKVGSK